MRRYPPSGYLRPHRRTFFICSCRFSVRWWGPLVIRRARTNSLSNGRSRSGCGQF